jgi:hypothetical protein
MANVSPGVYSKIIDLSTYIQAVPSTIGCIMVLSTKGKDNQFTFVGSRSELISQWGEPNISDYGKNYGQGLYEAYNFLGESGALYMMRCLPDNATFGNIKLSVRLLDTDATATILISYTSDLNNMDEIQTNLEYDGVSKIYPICYLHPVGRGEYYNQISVRFTEHANPMLNDVYVLDIYEKQSDGDEIVVESFEVSFNPKAVDTAGDSIFIGYILETYSQLLRCTSTLPGSTEDNTTYSDGINMMARVYDKDIGYVTVVKTDGAAVINDSKQDFGDWKSTAGLATYMVIAKDGKGNKLYGWLGDVTSTTEDGIKVYNSRDLAKNDF